MTKLMTIEGESSLILGEVRAVVYENPGIMGFLSTGALMAIAARRLARRAARRGAKRIARRIIMNRLKRRARQW